MVFLLVMLPSIAGAASVTKINLTKDTQLQVQGTSNFSLATRNQSSSYETDKLNNGSNNRQDQNFATENNSQLYLKIENQKSFSELTQSKIGFAMKVESELSSAQNKGVINADQGFIYSDFEDSGKFEIGDNVAVNQKMKVGVTSFARGNGGINGNYLKYLNLPIQSQFILIAQSPIGHGGSAINGSNLNQNSIKILRNGSFNGAEDATKLNYYSPRIEGLQIGASYTPNTSNSLVSSTVFSGAQNAISDVFSLAANYSNNLENFDYAFSATTEQGKAKNSLVTNAARNNLSAYDIATSLAYFGFTFGASFGSWGKSLQQKNDPNSGSANYKTIGLAYQLGHFSVSVSGLKSRYQKNDYAATSLGLDYKLNKAFMPYFEITQFRFKSNQSQNPNNQGFVVLGGFLLSF